jgi:hypothetical protein
MEVRVIFFLAPTILSVLSAESAFSFQKFEGLSSYPSSHPVYELLARPISFEPVLPRTPFFSAEIDIISNDELTDAVLPRMDPKEVGLFYDLMKKVDAIFRRNHLCYWASCGTLLGAVRHKGMIPWDDDLDIAIFAQDAALLESLSAELEEVGLELYYYPSLQYYKVFFRNGSPIKKRRNVNYPWTYPFLDIFPLTEVNGKVTYIFEHWRKKYPRDYFLPSQLEQPLEEYAFGPLSLPGPHGAVSYLERQYGQIGMTLPM